MSTDFEQYMLTGKEIIEQHMEKVLTGNIPPLLYDSMAYSLFAGGKRLRPLLLFASFQSYQHNLQKVYHTATALEMIHTYSLIHDDLPAMDDDSYRRGKLTNHKKFDEGTAILAGDALLTYSFQLIAQDPLLTSDEKIYIIESLAKSSGPEGMVAGQILDIEGETKQLTLEQLEEVHQLKTGQLISFAVEAGAYLANVDKESRKHLQQFAHYLGLIFQVQDDVLDVIGDEQKLGKRVGSDTIKKKSTYPSLLGLEGAKEKLKQYEQNALDALEKANVKHRYLYDLLYYFGERDH